MDDAPHCQPCPPDCPSVFDRVVVSYLIRGGTRVMFELLETFLDPGPLAFQLQYSETSNPAASDWADVGLEAVDQYAVVDPEQRAFGKLNTAHYRVRLTTPLGVYYSEPTGVRGTLDHRDWRLAREVVRQRRVLYRYGPGGQLGYLLKRRWTGARCTFCTDLQTGECRNPDCPYCYGTGVRCGYYYPISCVWASLEPRAYHLERDGGEGRGTVADIVVRGDMLQTELLAEEDVWVNARTDDRYFVHRVQHTAEIRGVPLAAQVELRPAAFTSVIYTIPIPAQLRALGQDVAGVANPDVEDF